MNTRKLGTIEVWPIGMGCMGFSHGYGEIPARDYSIQAIRRAHAFGCTFFDTAESYGPNLLPENQGHNERIVGEAVHGHRGFVDSRAAAWQTGTGSNDWGPLPGHVCCPGFKIRGTVPVIHIDHRNRPPIILIKLLLVDFGTPGYPRWRYGTCSTQLLLRAYYRR